MMSNIGGSCRGLDIAEHAAKKRRRSNDDNGGRAEQLALPPEVWAAVMEYVPFETILSCGATCRSMLHDSCKLLRTLCINKPSQLNLAVASRFRDVREIHINSLFRQRVEHYEDEEFREVIIDFETKNRVIPFILHFGKLERLFFGVVDISKPGEVVMKNFDVANEYFYEGDDVYPNDGDRDALLQFIDGISACYRCGALPKRLKISGLCCPYVSEGHSPTRNCEVCSRAIKSFPLDSLLSFECQGSSSNRALSGRSFGLDVCLNRTQMEKIIESRPGGCELLRSEERLLQLLGKARRYKIVADQGNPLYIAKFDDKDIVEIQRVIKYAGLDVEGLPKQKVSAAIKISFAKDDADPVPPDQQCYLCKTSLDELKGKVGLDLLMDDFERPLSDMVMHAHHFAWVLIHCHLQTLADDDDNAKGEYDDIQLDCLHFIRRFMEEVESEATLNEIILPAIADAIPSIVTDLDGICDERCGAACSILDNILTRGSREHMGVIIQAGAIESFSRLLRSTKDCVVIDVLSSLSIIAGTGKDEYIQRVAKAAAIDSHLAHLLDSKSHWVVKTSLKVLIIIDHSPPLSILIQFIKSLDSSNILEESSIIFRQIVEASDPPIQRIIDSGVLPRLVDIIKTTGDSNIQANLAHALMTIACSKEHISALVGELISFFLSFQDSGRALFQDSYCGATAENAIWVSCFSAKRNELSADNLVELIKSPNGSQIGHSCDVIHSKSRAGSSTHKCTRSHARHESIDVLADCSILLRLILEGDKSSFQRIIDSGILPRLVEVIKTTEDSFVQTNLASVLTTIASLDEQTTALVDELISFLVALQSSSCDATAEKATFALNNIASVGATGTWFSWKKKPSLGWGEFEVKGELVDSDYESDVSFEEAEEVNDTHVELEVMQSVAGNGRMEKSNTAFGIDQFQLKAVIVESPTLMGMSDALLEKILQFLDVSEITLCEGICKRFAVSRSDDFWRRYRHTSAASSRTKQTAFKQTGGKSTLICVGNIRALVLQRHGLMQIRHFQKRTDNDILTVLGCETTRAEVFRTVCSDLLSRMIHTNNGPAVHFKLRGDSIFYLAELAHAFMVEKLGQALLAAIHSHRTKVQASDIQFVCKNNFYPFDSCSSLGNLKREGKHEAIETTPSSCPSLGAGENVWHWPGDDACHEALPPETGRRIIRRLAYRAGINEMTSDAFLQAEAEMLRTIGSLLVDAFESSADMAKSASFLQSDVTLVYRMPMKSDLLVDADGPSVDYFGKSSHQQSYTVTDEERTHDMFKVPPPPFGAENETIYTIVPGQIVAAAKQRNIILNNVYGDGWVPSLGFNEEEEREIEESYYFRPYYEDCSDADSDLDDDDYRSDDDDMIQEMIVDGCGVPGINGVYTRAGIHDNVPMYSRTINFDGREEDFHCSDASSQTIQGDGVFQLSR